MKLTFKRQRIELCRVCQGGGFAPAADGATIMPVCPVCQGGGRVTKTWEGTVTIEPYLPDNNPNSNPWQDSWL